MACAIAMQQAMNAVNQHAPLLGLTSIEMGVGIHTGEVVVGNIGSLKRAKYGIVGSHMNLTSRIESYTVGGQVLISEATHQLLRSLVQTNGLMQIETKGFQQAVTLYDVQAIDVQGIDVQAIDGGFYLALPEKVAIEAAAAIPIPVQFAVIEGKQIQAKRTDGLLHQVSSQGALLQSPVAIALFSNLKLNLDSPDRTADFYAKVMAEVSGRADSLTYQVRFTFIPPDVLNGLAPLQ